MNNKLQLDKIVELSNLTYNNYKVNTTPILLVDLQEKINKILTLQTQNEKNNLFKYNFVSLHEIIGKNVIINFDPMILLNPINFKINEKNMEWVYMLHAFLLLLHDDYLKEDNYIKSSIFKIAYDKYKIVIDLPEILTDNDLQNIANTTGINLVIITEKNIINIYKNIKSKNWIVLIKLCGMYFPLYDFTHKCFKDTSNFITYLQSIGNVIDIKKKIIKPMIKYEEEQSNDEDKVQFISEKVPDNIETPKTHIKTKTKTKQDSKNDIFLPNPNINKVVETIKEEDNTLENNNKDELVKFLNNIKSTTKLEDIQKFALLYNLTIIKGTTKEGKPKYRTKQDLIDDLQKIISK